MKSNSAKKIVFMIASLLVIAGCAQPKPTTPIPGAEDLPPDKIVDRLFSSFAFDDIAGADKYFSTRIPQKLAVDFISDFNSSKRVGRFKTFLVNDSGNEAEVKVIYNFSAMNAETGMFETKKQVDTRHIKLLKESDYWKISSMGIEEFDQAVEKHMFMECLGAVLDAVVAQEKYRRGHDAYSGTIGSLVPLVSFDDAKCADMRVSNADASGYLIEAVTRNSKPCDIVADTDSYSPATYEECLTAE
ncbi:MAG TPA: hypothetical protein PLS19_06385 [bacterium]|nr:hypothetical protein [bacterium]HPN94173.1 hypothetical protein [bacterium]